MARTREGARSIRHGAPGVRWCLGIVVTITSAACAPSPDPTHQTVEYYRANPSVREARLAECVSDPGGLGQTPDCINARAAARQAGIGSLRDLPPMGLPGATPAETPRRTDVTDRPGRPDDEPAPRRAR